MIMLSEFFSDNCSYIVGILIVFIVLVNVIVDNFRKKTKYVTNYSACTSPTCVRCNKYDYICKEAQSKLKLEKIDSERLSSSVLLMNSNCGVSKSPKLEEDELQVQQLPSVFRMRGLCSSPLWKTEKFQSDMNKLVANYENILKEFQVVYESETGWSKNETPTGSWCIYPIINQGDLVEENASMCPQTLETILSLKSLMNLNVFGNATFSVVNPKTSITDHYGPTNIRIRCHLGLIIPNKCNLRVAGEVVRWKKGDVLLFDDSYKHSVHYEGEGDGIRAILMVDLWHPDISDSERNSIDYLFSQGNNID